MNGEGDTSIVSERKHEDVTAISKRQSDDLMQKFEAIRDEFDRYKSETEMKMTEMYNEIKSKAEEIANLKKREDDWKSRITQLENEVKEAKSGDNSKMSADVQGILEKVEKNPLSLLNRPTEMTFHAKFTEISKLTSKRVFSEPTKYAGVTWRLSVREKSDDYIDLNLSAQKKDAVEWWCPVLVEFQVISSNGEKIFRTHNEKIIYDANERSVCMESMSYKDLFNQTKGYVMDDSVIVAVAIRPLPSCFMEATDTTIRFKFTDIWKIADESLYSQPIDFAGVTLQTNVSKFFLDESAIMFSLVAENKNAVEWHCPVIVEFRLIAQKSGESIRIGDTKAIYDAEHRYEYLKPFYEDLFNEWSGFVMNDSILVDAVIKAFPAN